MSTLDGFQIRGVTGPSTPFPWAGAAVPLLYAALAALHAGGSPHETAAGLIYLVLAFEHLRLDAQRSGF